MRSSNPNDSLEDAGLCYVRELISRCFFQDYDDLPFFSQALKCTILHYHWLKISVLDSISFFHQTNPKSPNESDNVWSIFHGRSYNTVVNFCTTCKFILFYFSSLNFMIQKTQTTSPLHSESGTPLLSQSFLPIKHFSPHS